MVMVCDSNGPAEMPVRLIVCWTASSKIALGSEMESTVGRSLTGVTFTVKVCENVASSELLNVPSGPASRTVTAILAECCSWELASYSFSIVAKGQVITISEKFCRVDCLFLG